MVNHTNHGLEDFSPRFLRSLEEVSKDEMEVHQTWMMLNSELSDSLQDFLSRADESAFPLKVSVDRLRAAVGVNQGQQRLGLVFKDTAQQGEFAENFKGLMEDAGYTSFALVATGSAFQGLSTNPWSYKKLGYMKVCGETGETDLDLQIYCGALVQKSIQDELPVFLNHFEITSHRGQQYAKLITFNNKDNPESSAPYVLEPWIREFEARWTEALKPNFQGTGIVFNGISIALMTESQFRGSKRLGSPYQLC